ncbi:MAG: hypothetical protein IT290_04690 [Deltaproteobacteria bacterium]|nr:hypothetical protein [Deltaproteobacteria bacterium]
MSELEDDSQRIGKNATRMAVAVPSTNVKRSAAKPLTSRTARSFLTPPRDLPTPSRE